MQPTVSLKKKDESEVATHRGSLLSALMKQVSLISCLPAAVTQLTKHLRTNLYNKFVFLRTLYNTYGSFVLIYIYFLRKRPFTLKCRAVKHTRNETEPEQCQMYGTQRTAINVLRQFLYYVTYKCVYKKYSGDEKDAMGFNRNKDRLTVLLCADASGQHQLTLVIIGKCKITVEL